MGYLHVLAVSLCYCTTNKEQNTAHVVVQSQSALQISNRDVLNNNIKHEPEEYNASVTNTASDVKLSSDIETKTSNAFAQHIVKPELVERMLATSTISRVDAHCQKTESTGTDTYTHTLQKPTTMTKQSRRKQIARRICTNRLNKKALMKKESSSNLKHQESKKGFNQQQINYLAGVTKKNKENYRQHMTEYFRLCYPNKLLDDIFEEFSETNKVNIRSHTLKRKNFDKNKELITEDNYDLGNLHTDFTPYYHNNNALFLAEELNTRDKLFKRLYVCYENGSATYNVTKHVELSPDVYCLITENILIADKEKNLFCVNQFFDSISMYPLIIDRKKLNISKNFVYNFLIYVSTRLDSNMLNDQNTNTLFNTELNYVFKNLLLPDETDYLHTFIFLAYLENPKNKKSIFIDKLSNPEYVYPIAFYHFKYLYYVFYNVHRLGPYADYLFYKSMIDFPGSLTFLNSIVDRFVTNTLYLLYYKRNVSVDILDSNIKFRLLDYILNNGLRYLDRDIALEHRLENLLDDSILLLDLKTRD